MEAEERLKAARSPHSPEGLNAARLQEAALRQAVGDDIQQQGMPRANARKGIGKLGQEPEGPPSVPKLRLEVLELLANQIADEEEERFRRDVRARKGRHHGRQLLRLQG